MEAVLDGATGEDAPAARAMRSSLAATGVTAQHCRDVLRAFRVDATKLRYEDWDDLMDIAGIRPRRSGQLSISMASPKPPTLRPMHCARRSRC